MRRSPRPARRRCSSEISGRRRIPRLVLASASPQRRAILEQIGADFEVRPADVEETTEGPPVEVARANARLKALAAAQGGRDEIVLGVDTLVTLDGTIHGKPADAEHAAATLRILAGRTHDVISGVAVVRDGEAHCDHAVTAVAFRELDHTAIEAYVATGEWAGRAGGYAIQGRGAALVRRIEGDYLNVVGLPLVALLDGLLRDWERAGHPVD